MKNKESKKIKILVINHVPEVDLGSYEEFSILIDTTLNDFIFLH